MFLTCGDADHLLGRDSSTRPEGEREGKRRERENDVKLTTCLSTYLLNDKSSKI